ncbi:MAG: molecular chaperone DnaK [Candidatus Lokiarchaeota archaeon]|nr:molecular chaperone DnaK [Candidatus Lokiarchaeota archaeon]
MAKILGIDLGTSNSAAAVFMGGKAVIVPSAEGVSLGGKAFPSVIAFTKDGQRLIGEPARRQAVSNPDRTIMAIKRKMGTDHKVTIDGKSYTPQEISAMLLRKIKDDAEAFIGEPISEVIITVPAYFNDNQRQATKDAGRIAGFNVKRLINEPTAAAFAYGLDKENAQLKIVVLDLGGGTFDVTIMEMDKGVFTVISTSGDTALGGTDMDKLLLDYVVSEFQREQGMDIRKDSMAMQRLREAVEKAKIELSTTLKTDINLPYITADSTGPKHLTMTLTRAKLEELIEPVLNRLEKPIKTALNDAKLTPNQIDKILLVGGPTRMPSVRARFGKILGKEPERGIDPMECVALGAAIQGGVLTGDVKDLLLLDVTPLSLGVETLGNVFTRLIERNTTIPTQKKEIFSTAEDNQNAVTINVLQGERKMASDNISLGRFNLVGIPPAPRGIPQIEVAFDIDANGILNVTAKDLATGKSQAITITASNKLSEAEIDKKIKEAEKFAEEDKKRFELVQLKNQAESMIYQTEKLMKENEAKVGDLKSTIDQKILALKGAVEANDATRIKTSLDDLQNALHQVSQRLYQASGGGPSYQGGPTPDQQYHNYQKATESDDTVDVDYEVN